MGQSKYSSYETSVALEPPATGRHSDDFIFMGMVIYYFLFFIVKPWWLTYSSNYFLNKINTLNEIHFNYYCYYWCNLIITWLHFNNTICTLGIKIFWIVSLTLTHLSWLFHQEFDLEVLFQYLNYSSSCLQSSILIVWFLPSHILTVWVSSRQSNVRTLIYYVHLSRTNLPLLQKKSCFNFFPQLILQYELQYHLSKKKN